jgi:hypothetical protein
MTFHFPRSPPPSSPPVPGSSKQLEAFRKWAVFEDLPDRRSARALGRKYELFQLSVSARDERRRFPGTGTGGAITPADRKRRFEVRGRRRTEAQRRLI